MMTRETAGPCLLAALEAAGVRRGRIELPAIWKALAAWLHGPVGDVEPPDDRRFFYLSFAPAGVDPTGHTFAGEPPTAIAGRDLICIEFGREFVRRTGPHSTRLLGSAGLALWYEAGPAWDPLRETPEWIELGVSTCHYDWSADGRRPTSLTSKLERSPVFDIASSERARVMTLWFRDENANGPDVVIVASRPTSDS
jgi:hypothetical protein